MLVLVVVVRAVIRRLLGLPRRVYVSLGFVGEEGCDGWWVLFGLTAV